MTKRIQKSNQRSKFQEAFSGFFRLPIGVPRTFNATAGQIKDPKGSALVMAAIFMLVATTLMTVGMRLISDASKNTKQQELYIGEAENAARAGLQDAAGWYKRQVNKGVTVAAFAAAVTAGETPTWAPNSNSATPGNYTFADEAFNPQNNVNAQLTDTSNAAIGIVEEYPLDSAVSTQAVFWSRYEVRKVQDPTQVTPAATWDPNAVHDVTGNRSSGVNGNGIIWSIVSTGYVYKRMSYTTAGSPATFTVQYNQAPNTIVAMVRYYTEFRKLGLSLPSTNASLETGAVYVQATTQVDLANSETTIDGAVSAQGNYSIIAMTK